VRYRLDGKPPSNGGFPDSGPVPLEADRSVTTDNTSQSLVNGHSSHTVRQHRD
jgi:hypothetical protein